MFSWIKKNKPEEPEIAEGKRKKKAAAVSAAPPVPEKVVFRFRYCIYIIAAMLTVLAIYSHDARDFAIIAGGREGAVSNWVGDIGAWISTTLFYLFGVAVYPIVLLMLLCAIRPFIRVAISRKGYVLAVTLVVLGIAVIFAYSPERFAPYTDTLGIGRKEMPSHVLSGGVVGQWIAAPERSGASGVVRKWIGNAGTLVSASVFVLSGTFFIWLADWHPIARRIWVNVTDNAVRKREEEETEPAPKKVKPVAPPTPEPLAPEPLVMEFAPTPVVVQPPPEPLEPVPVEVLPVVPPQPVILPQSGPAKVFTPKPDPIPEGAPTPVTPPAPPPPSPMPVPEPPPEPVAPAPIPAPALPPRPPMPVPTPTVGAPPEVDYRLQRREIEGAKHNNIIPEMESGNKIAEEYVVPPISMLSPGKNVGGETEETINHITGLLQETLNSFNVDGQVVGAISGPRVTRYEITLAPGVKVEKVSSIQNNIKMQLAAQSLRILAPIPGKNAVGVEVPNRQPESVFMRSLLESADWKASKAEIPVVLGKDVGGKTMILDLARAPHLLIAGATGSGKSVCMNTLIMSLLMRFSPDDLRLIMVDPKVVEMEMYQTLPHLITPVVNDPQKVPIALRWGVNEMEKRYRILAKARTKNLAGFNSRPKSDTVVKDDEGKPIPDKLPILVIIVDELADVMMTDAKADVETSIARIAQKGRAAGIHIVIATQRPSIQVITGIIKANLPTRIAFKVTSGIDSRVILDKVGAEELLGRGDMLFVPPGASSIERIQGAMVDDPDIEKIVEFVSAQAPQRFDSTVLKEEAEGGDDDDGGNFDDDDGEASIHDFDHISPMVQKYMQPDDDDLMRKSLEIVLMERKASTSYLQRRLKIGYNRAAEIIDKMEERGLVSPPVAGGSKRDILVFDDIVNE